MDNYIKNNYYLDANFNICKKHDNVKVGFVGPKGYIRVNIKGKYYYAHRLVWFLHYGVWPSGQIDHINMCKHDNRIVNLREATSFQNMQNQKVAHSNSKTGILGVTFNGKSYRAKIFKNGKPISLGSFATAQEASNAYLNAKATIHEFFVN